MVIQSIWKIHLLRLKCATLCEIFIVDYLIFFHISGLYRREIKKALFFELKKLFWTLISMWIKKKLIL